MRRVSVWTVSAASLRADFPDGWLGVRRIIRVERTRTLGEKTSHTTQYYISSYPSTSARRFGEIIRAHWQIENRLHYVRDVHMHEDSCGLRDMTMATNLSTIRTVAFNLFRDAGFASLKYALIRFANRIDKLAELVLST